MMQRFNTDLENTGLEAPFYQASKLGDEEGMERVEVEDPGARSAAPIHQESPHIPFHGGSDRSKSAPHPAAAHASDDPSSGNGHCSTATAEAPLGAEEASLEDKDPSVIERGFSPVLRNQNFLALWAGQVFSQIADKVYLVLMIMIISTQIQSTGQTVSGWVSSIMVAFTIPAVLFGSVAGVFVDYWPKKGVLVLTNLFRGLLVLALPVLLGLAGGGAIASVPVDFGVLLGITFLVSTLTQFFAPAEQAIIPLVVERRHLLSANSLYTTTMMASLIVGFAVGDPLLSLADRIIPVSLGAVPIGKALLVGGSYVLASVLLLLIRPHEPKDRPHREQPPIWEDIRDGLKYLHAHRQVRAALIQLVMLFSIFAALAVLAVRLAEVMPALSSSQFGFLLAAGGIGMALGALIVGHWGHDHSPQRMSLFGSIGIGLTLVALSLFTQQLFPSLIILVGLGACAALVGVPLQTTIQEQTPEDMRGKVFGLQNNAVNIALSLPLALAGIAETFLGLRMVLLILAGVAIASGLFTWGLSRKEST